MMRESCGVVLEQSENTLAHWTGSDIHVMLALRRCSRQVVVADKQLDGPDMVGEFLGNRLR